MIDEFADSRAGGLLFHRPPSRGLDRPPERHSRQRHPSGNGLAATALLRLGALTGRADLTASGKTGARGHRGCTRARAGRVRTEPHRPRFPAGEGHGIRRDRQADDPNENRAVLEAIATFISTPPGRRPGHRPSRLPHSPAKSHLLADRPARDGRTTTYICENFTCQAPVVGLEGLKKHRATVCRMRNSRPIAIESSHAHQLVDRVVDLARNFRAVGRSDRVM